MVAGVDPLDDVYGDGGDLDQFFSQGRDIGICLKLLLQRGLGNFAAFLSEDGGPDRPRVTLLAPERILSITLGADFGEDVVPHGHYMK